MAFNRFRFLRVWVWVGLMSLAVRPLAAQTAITIPNFGFESPSTGNFDAFSGADWQATDAGVLLFAGFSGLFPLAGSAPEGLQLAFLNVGPIFQVLGTTYQSGETYTLSGYIGARTDNPSAAGSFNLMSGATVLASSGTVTPTTGGLQPVTFSYTAQPADQGNPIRIQMDTAGTGQLAFDNVQLTAVPEPSTCAAMMGAAVLAWTMRRRHAAAGRAQSLGYSGRPDRGFPCYTLE